MLHPRQVRALRGALTALAATFIALVSHVSAGGAMPGALGVATPLILSIFVSVLLARSRLSLGRLTVSVALSQTLFHTLFVLGTPSTLVAQSAGHHLNDTLDLSVAGAMAGARAMHGDSAMWAHHGVAAIVTIALIAQGERILSALAAFAWFVLRLMTPISWLALARPQRASVAVRSMPTVRTLSHRAAPAQLRGPPLVGMPSPSV